MTLAVHIRDMDLERIVLLDYQGRQFTFRVDHQPPLSFWRVEPGIRAYSSSIRVSGNEQPTLFSVVGKVRS